MFLPRLVPIAALISAAFLSGCQPGHTTETVVFATISEVLATAEGTAPVAGTASETSLPRLQRAIREINDSKDIRFVVLLGDLIGSDQFRSVDRLKGALAELSKPYYVVLGPEAAGRGGAGGEGAAPGPGEKPPGGASLMTWAFAGHGFSGPEPYWSASLSGGLFLIALYTGGPGSGAPGHVDAEQMKWLEKTLEEHPKEAIVVLSYHALVWLHPLDNTEQWRNRLVDNGQEVMDLLGRRQNVVAVISASHRFSASRVMGSAVYISVPGLSVWPLAYSVVKIAPRSMERQYFGVGTDDEERVSLDRLVAEKSLRALYGGGAHGAEQVSQLFGGHKLQSWNLNVMRP